MAIERGIIEFKSNFDGFLGKSRIDGYWIISNDAVVKLKLDWEQLFIDPEGRICKLDYGDKVPAIDGSLSGFKLRPIQNTVSGIDVNKKLLLVNF